MPSYIDIEERVMEPRQFSLSVFIAAVSALAPGTPFAQTPSVVAAKVASGAAAGASAVPVVKAPKPSASSASRSGGDKGDWSPLEELKNKKAQGGLPDICQLKPDLPACAITKANEAKV